MKPSSLRLASLFVVYAMLISSIGVITGSSSPSRAYAEGSSPPSVTASTYNKVVQITWDGFYNDLYDLAKKQNKPTPNLDRLVNNGMRLTQHKTTVPSAVAGHISAMTGAYPKTTGNTYSYLDGTTAYGFNSTLNQAQTLTKAMQNLRTATVINESAAANESAPTYRYERAASNSFADSVTNATYQLDTYGQPDYLNLFSDDLYQIGRNPTLLENQAALETKMMDKLVQMDTTLGELIQQIDAKGDPARTTYILSSHSGNSLMKGKRASTLLQELNRAGFTTAEAAPGSGSVAVSRSPDVVTIKNYEASYLQMFIHNDSAMTQVRIDSLIALIKSQSYVKEVLTRERLDALGVHSKFADLLIIPTDDYTFCPASERAARPDSFLSAGSNMFGVISGNQIVNTGLVREQTSIVDLAPTVAALLGTPVPAQADGRSLLNARVENPIENYVLYVNLDGFAYKWYELANTAPYSGTPTLNALMQNGVHFTNAGTGIPSITDDMQQATASGAAPVDTGNDYRSYDAVNNVVVQYARDNKLENIAEAAVRNRIGLAAVNAFFFENKGAVAGDETRPYVVAATAPKSSNERADEMVKIIMGQPFQSGNKTMTLSEVPHFLAYYADDIDAIGHNNHTEAGGAYGVLVTKDAATYYDNVAKAVIRVDQALGKIVQALKDRGIYDRTTIAITADHGMVSFGADGQPPENGPYQPGTLTSLPDLESTIADVGLKFRGEAYRVETVYEAGKSAKPETEIVITSVGLQAQIKFRVPVERAVMEEIITRVKTKDYYGAHMYKEEIVKQGTPATFADLLISPNPPYHFKTGDPTKLRTITGQHDSLHDDAQRIFTLLSGAGIQKGIVYPNKVYNMNIAPTIGRMLGIEGPSGATAKVLDEVLEPAYQGPPLQLSSPASNDVYVSEPSMAFTGTTAPQAVLKVNDAAVATADGAGAFTATLPLKPGINRLIVEANSNGRETREVVYVTYTVPREALLQQLAAARSLYDAAVEGSAAGQYGPGSKLAFKPALTEATILSENIDATADQLAAGLSRFTLALMGFRAAERPGNGGGNGNGNGNGGGSIYIPGGQTPSTGNGQPAAAALDASKWADLLQNRPNQDDNQLILSIPNSQAGAVLEIPADVLALAAQETPGMTITVQTGMAAYHLPIQALDLPGIAARLGTTADKMKVKLTIAKSEDEQGRQLIAQVQEAGASPLSVAIEFSLAVEGPDGKQAQIESFGDTYVARTVTIPGYIDSTRASAVWYDPATGEYAFVPAVFTAKDGKTEVTIKRNGNSVYMVVSANKSFTDVNSHWAKTDIELLASKLLVQGVTDHSFAPDGEITRAQFAAMLTRALALQASAEPAAFTDVAAADWFAGAVNTAAHAGLITGLSDGTFRPNAAITREEIAVMLSRALRIAGQPAAAEPTAHAPLSAFSDRGTISAWALEAASAVVQAGIVNGLTESSFAPAELATRAQAAVMLKRFLQNAAFMN